MACSFYRDIFSCFLLEFCCDIIWQYRDIVLLRLSSLYRDMSVLCRDIKTFLQHNLSFSVASEFCRDINFFVATKLLVFQRCSMLRHKFEMLQHKLHYRVSLLFSHLHLLSWHSFLLSGHNSLALQLYCNILLWFF